jgi:hypothetical protein
MNKNNKKYHIQIIQYKINMDNNNNNNNINKMNIMKIKMMTIIINSNNTHMKI